MARTNSLTLGDMNRNIDWETDCFMCGEDAEDLSYFLLDFRKLWGQGQDDFNDKDWESFSMEREGGLLNGKLYI